MTSLSSRNARNCARSFLVAAAAAGLAVGIAGCEKKKKPAPPPPPPPAPVHVDPDPVDIHGIMAELAPDARVQFPAEKAPADRGLAEAAIRLADAFAKGDTAALRGMLTPEARGPLDSLVAEGLWAEETKKIEQVRVVQVDPRFETEASRGTIVLALQAPGGAYPLAWEARRSGQNWVFKNMPVEDKELRRASDFDNQSLRVGSAMMAPDPAETEGLLDESGGDPGAMPEHANPDAPTDDGVIRKHTPAGPVNIPTKPGGG